ncbi:MAG: O-antigen ligase family protein, partial [Actinomycetia bacterium]|nr:O-antigen ligase family protein [Actinomycetes bacterium]
ILLFVPVELTIDLFAPGAIKYVDEAILILIFIALFFRITAIKKSEFQSTPLDRPFILFILIGFLSLVINKVPFHIGIAGLRAILQYVLLYYVIIYSEISSKTLRNMVWLSILTAGALSVGGLIQGVLGPSAFNGWFMNVHENPNYRVGSMLRIFSTMTNPNTFGTYLTVLFPVTLGIALHERHGGRRLLLFLLATPMLLALLLTFSRESWVGLFAGIAVVGALIDRRIITILVIILIAASITFPQQVMGRIIEGFSFEYLRSSYGPPTAIFHGGGRAFYYIQSIKVIKDNFLFGVGPGRFGGSVAYIFPTPVYEKYNIPMSMNQIDTFWMQLWGEVGTLGLLMFLIMLGMIFLRARKLILAKNTPLFLKGLTAGFIAGFIAVSVEALAANIFEVHATMLFFWFFMAVFIKLSNKVELQKT